MRAASTRETRGRQRRRAQRKQHSVAGTSRRRSIAMERPHAEHVPYRPSTIRMSAASTRANSSTLLWRVALDDREPGLGAHRVRQTRTLRTQGLPQCFKVGHGDQGAPRTGPEMRSKGIGTPDSRVVFALLECQARFLTAANRTDPRNKAMKLHISRNRRPRDVVETQTERPP